MSRNFELLQSLGFEQEVLKPITPAIARHRAASPAVRPAARVPADPHIASLVQRLFLGGADTATRSVSFIPASDDASSTICERAAEMLAAQGIGSVCIADANFASPSVHKYFRIANTRGFAEAIAGVDDIAAYSQVMTDSNLTVVTAGHARLQALATEAASARIRELMARFDFLLVRTPPADESGIASLLGRLTGNAVLVIEANETRRDAAARVKLQLQQNGVTVLGAVLNNRTYPIPQSLYSKLF